MGLAPKLQAHIKTYSMLEPGRSHVLGFLTRASSGEEADERIYSDQVQSLVQKGVYKTTNATLNGSTAYSVTTEFAMREPALMHGIDHNGGDNEVSQVFFSPFAWNAIPGIRRCGPTHVRVNPSPRP